MPVVSAINGPAIGAGFVLASVRATQGCRADASFSVSDVEIRLALDNWSIRRLSALVGHGRARAMLSAES